MPRSFVSFFFGSSQSGLATDQEKADTLARITTGYPGLLGAPSATVDLLYAEAKSKYDAGRARSQALDAKAGTLITIITTGFGAFAILGDPAKLGLSAWIVLGLVAFAAAFILALVAQVPRDVQFPEVSMYASLALVKDPRNSIRVKYELTRSWLRDADANDRAGFAKRRLLNFSTALVGVGLAALTLNYTLAPSGEKPVPTVRVILEPTSLPTTHH
jgi:hypothetical protein